ncbi:MAG: threonine--tRNA ligase [Gammaproteobacteria bacterium]|nr:threonine--tRNA ligase [Gammaproteobacteria bacterium]|tara:strand:+ start:261225 stop:263123 length:1899 start_codon:yes stop_codon:yes gene_type:complete
MLKIVINNKKIDLENSKSIESLTNENFKEKNFVAARVDNKLVDMSNHIESDCKIELIKSTDQEGLEIIRHTCAHVFGHAIKQIYPDCKMVIGPVIDNGFYYDVLTKETISEKDLITIEKLMKKLAKKNYIITREVVTKDKAIKIFKKRNEDFKLKLIDEIPENEIIAVYHHEEYIDMCRGPHLTNTKHLKAFKLTKISGSYWKGNSSNQQLQRIYGTAWNSQDELNNYLKDLEEAEKRDHRKLGQKLDYFHFQEESPGMVFWHDKGWTLFNLIKEYISNYLYLNNYKVINTPQILDKSLWKKSGHLDKFSDLIFDINSENREYAIKPMSCPGHIQIYNQGIRSYKDLPVKLAEFGLVHRNEPSGTLHGLLRIRAFTQDDAHIFCTPEQIEEEIIKLIDDIQNIYQDFGFKNLKIELSTRPEKRVGSEKIWDISESALKSALKRKNIDWSLNDGDGAFYGPKIDFSLHDSLNRIWQLGTIQLDFSMPERLKANYVDKDGIKQHPVMIHRAILGSLERFVGILIENYAGNLPLWLSPVQVVVLNITSKHEEFSNNIVDLLRREGFRVDNDFRNEKISYKIREHTIKRIPYLVIIGDKEIDNNQISVRLRNGDDLGSMTSSELVKKLKNELADKR